MTDTPADPPALMLLFEEQVAAALELPEKERALAFEKLRADHPNHARLLERCEHAVASLMPEKRSVSAISDAVRSVALAEAPERIGDYRIVDVLGEGGMGIVYLADQQQPIRRRVALKVVKSVSAHRDALARFEVERQSLAMMEHPNIAMVLDAGEADDGRPFFAMEHVPGLPITEFCDRHRLDLRARIALFQKVCRGVQHAHEKGVVHRDLKPTNILVGHRDGLPEPKIIDFGVAKALQQRLTERTLYTEHGRILGTPEYMSPEQAGLGEIDPDARSDVYSLGVLLYELLVGALPFDSRELRKAGYLEIQRKIREDEPTKPSTRFTTDDASTAEVARQRGTDRNTLLRALRGDLDWITMRCLEKDPARRYSAAQDLADELERYLANVPVLARRPSLSYRLMKAMRRQRSGLLAAAAVVVALAIGMSLPGLLGSSMAGSVPTTGEALSTSALCPFYDDHGGFSLDGRYFTHTDWANGNLMVHDTMTGATRRLTTDARWGKDDGNDRSRYASFSGIGPDNRTVAYSWDQDGVPELRILDLADPTPRTVVRDPNVDELGFYDFTPDGEQVLIVAERDKGASTLELIRLADGSRQVVTGLRATRSSVAKISPDGSWIVYEDIADSTTSRRQLQLVATAGGQARPLAGSPGFDARPLWTPDGRHVVFRSDRGGSMGIWAVRVDGGQAAATAFRVEALGDAYPLGFLADGSFLFARSEPNHDVFVANYTPDRSPATSASTRLAQSFLGSNYAPCWSPDGRTIAYLSPRGALAAGTATIVLVLHEVETGTERALATPGFRMLRSHQVHWKRSSPPRFSPDGQRIVLSGSDPTGAIIARSVDLATGQARPLPIPDADRPCMVYPLSGGDYLYRSMVTPGLFEYSAATDGTRKVSDRFGSFFVTRDEREIVVCGTDEVFIVERADGSERRIHAAPSSTRLSGLLLSTIEDEGWLVLSESSEIRPLHPTYLRIRLRDGRAEPVALELGRQLEVVSASPDGRRWTYQGPSGRAGPGQVWRFLGALLK